MLSCRSYSQIVFLKFKIKKTELDKLTYAAWPADSASTASDGTRKTLCMNETGKLDPADFGVSLSI